MNERDALMRAILTDPADDTPRLVFADWLEENGEGARAEFIRLQIQLERMPRGRTTVLGRPCVGEVPEWRVACRLKLRERELFEAHAAGWVPVSPGYGLSVDLVDAGGLACVNASYNRYHVKVTGDMRFYFARGFCSEWWAPLDDIVGDEWECPRCLEQAPDWETNVVECRACDSTGVTGEAGHAEAVFRACPVTRVCVTTQSPDIIHIHDGTGRWIWRRWPEVDTREILPGYLPKWVWEHDAVSADLFDMRGGRSAIAFLSRELAERGLSDRLVEHCRELAGLPPLPLPAAA